MKLIFVVLLGLFVCGALGTSEVSLPEEIDTRVTNGQNAERGQFQSIVSVIFCLLGNILCQHICGATIITANRAVTAAHCITESPTIGNFRVRGGFLLQNDPASIGQTIMVATTTVHPNYQGGVNPFDIAMLSLETSFVFIVDVVQPSSLPVFEAIPTNNITLAGWGSTSTTQTPSMPNNLQFVVKPVLTIAQCANALNSLLGSSTPLANTNLCSLGPSQSACSGDSGGPVFQNNTVVGIVSWGIVPCGWPGAPSVHTRVSAFIPWIQSLL